MKRFFVMVFTLFYLNLLAVEAQDLVILRDGNVIEAKVAEISPTEIKYRRFNHLSGPIIVIARADVLSIRYENKTVEIFNPLPEGRQAMNQTGTPGESYRGANYPQIGEATPLQQILNRFPAIPIAGNNLRFEFGGENWLAKVNGESFSQGTVEYEQTNEGYTLTLTQTHIWPGAVGRTAGRVAKVVPGGGAASGALNKAGNVVGAVGPIEMTGSVIVLAYKATPPTSLKLVSISQNKNQKGKADTNAANVNTTGSEWDYKFANSKNNWISAELALIGIGARYERMLGSHISLGVNYFFFDSGVWSYYEINAFLRAYPLGKTFFLGLGFGYNENTYYYDYDYSYGGFTIIPEMGWKIDVGKPGGFFIMPCLTFPVVFVGEEEVGFGWRIFYFGMGVAF